MMVHAKKYECGASIAKLASIRIVLLQFALTTSITAFRNAREAGLSLCHEEKVIQSLFCPGVTPVSNQEARTRYSSFSPEV